MNRTIIPVRPSDWAMIKEVAPVAATARMFGVTEEQAAIVMLKGHELRLGLAASFEFIHMIEGKPSISPKGTLALIHSSGELKALEIKDLTDTKGRPTKCRVTMERTNGFKYTVEYSMDDAGRANLIKPKSAWEKYPANMLRWRAIGYCADVVFPDVAGGMLRPEELGAEVDEGGEPMWSEVTATIGTVEGAVGSQPHLREMPRYPLPVDIEGSGSVSTPASTSDPSDFVPIPVPTYPSAQREHDGEPTTKPLPPVPASISDPFVPFPIPTIDNTDSIGVDKLMKDKFSGPRTIAALIEAGYTVEAIVAANEGRVPSTAEDCIKVAKKLEAKDAAD